MMAPEACRATCELWSPMDIEATPPSAPAVLERRFYRHRLPVRVMHWINVVCLVVLLMSGLNIFIAHPALYWGKDSTFDSPWIAIGAQASDNGLVGVTRIGNSDFVTTGVLGVSKVDGRTTVRAFPSWAPIPSTQ